MIEVFALQEHAYATNGRRESRNLGERRGPTHVLPVQPVQFLNEVGVDHRLLPHLGQLIQCRNQRFRNPPPPEVSEVGAFNVGKPTGNFIKV